MTDFEMKKAALEKKQIRVKVKCRTFPVSEDGIFNFHHAFKDNIEVIDDSKHFDLNYYVPKEYINSKELYEDVKRAGQDVVKGSVVGTGRSMNGMEIFNVALQGRVLKTPLVFGEDYDAEIIEVIEYPEEIKLSWDDIKAVK